MCVSVLLNPQLADATAFREDPEIHGVESNIPVCVFGGNGSPNFILSRQLGHVRFSVSECGTSQGCQKPVVPPHFENMFKTSLQGSQGARIPSIPWLASISTPHLDQFRCTQY